MALRLNGINILRWGMWAFGLVMLANLVAFWLPRQIATAPGQVDMEAYYNAAQALAHHRSPYDAPVHIYGPDQRPVWYVYAPQFAVFVTPLALISYSWYAKIWLPILTMAILWYAYNLSVIISSSQPLKKRLDLTLCWALVLFATPGVLETAGIGNIDILIIAILSSAFISRHSNLIFAIMGQIKPFALLPLTLSLLTERKGFTLPAVTLIAGCCAGLIGCGISSYLEWRTVVTQILGQGTFCHANVSLSFGVLRLLQACGLWQYSHGPMNTGPRLFLAITGVVAPLIVVYLTRRLPLKEWYAISLLAAVAFSPICWTNYLAVGYIFVALRLQNWVRLRSHTSPTPAPAAASPEETIQ